MENVGVQGVNLGETNAESVADVASSWGGFFFGRMWVGLGVFFLGR